MAGSERVLIEGEAAQLFQEFSKIIQKSKEFEGGLKKISAESRKAAKEERDLARAAKRVYEETRTPQERHIQKMEQLNRLVRKGKLDQDTYRRAVRNSHEELRRSGAAGREAFGPAAAGQIKSMAMGVLSIGAAWGVVTRMIREMDAAREESAQKQRAAQFSTGALAQLAGGDMAEGQRLKQAGREIYAAGGARTLDEAMRVAFQLQSAGALGERAFISRTAAIAGSEGLVGLTGKAGKIREAFGESAGSYKQILSKAVAGAAPVTDVGMGDILQATAKAAGPARAMGISDEELFAAISRVSSVYSPDEASTAVSRLLDQLSAKGLAGKGDFADTLESLQGVDENKFFDIRARRAWRILKDTDAYRKRVGDIEAGQAGESIMGTIAVGERLAGPARRQQIAAAKKELAAEDLGGSRLRVQAWLQDYQGELLKEGKEVESWALWAGVGTLRLAAGDRAIEGDIEAAQTGFGGRYLENVHPAFRVLFDAADAMRGAAKALDQSSRSRPPTVSEE